MCIRDRLKRSLGLRAREKLGLQLLIGLAFGLLLLYYFQRGTTVIQMCIRDSLIVIAGKGHETYQLVMGQVLDFDDRKVAAEMIKEKM